MRILLIDEDEILIDILEKTFLAQNYTIDTVMDGEQGWLYVSTYNYDLIILNNQLPKLDGISLCKRIRHYGYHTPIFVLSTRHNSQEKTYAFDVGADDYICIPFDIEELMARVRAVLRRSQSNPNSSPLLNWGDLYLDPCICQVSYQGVIIDLTTKEYQLLELFLRHPHEVFSIEAIMENLWCSLEYPSEATVRSHIRYLRDKLKQAGLSEDPIETLRGRGYCLKSPPLKRPEIIQENNLIFPSEIEKEKQLQHLNIIDSIWEKYHYKRKEQINFLQDTLKQIKFSSLEKAQQIQALDITHKLAESLSIFSLEEPAYLASQLAKILEGEIINNYEKIRQFETILNNLIRKLNLEKKEKKDIKNYQVINHCYSILVIDDDEQFRELFIKEGVKRGIIVIGMKDLQVAKTWFKCLKKEEYPQIVVMKIAVNQWQQSLREEYFAFMTELNLQTPPIPTIIIGDRPRHNINDRTALTERLLIAEKGGTFYLRKPVTPQSAMEYCQIVLKKSSQGRKIMIVDEDEELLHLLPVWLQPWGFNITTLHDSRQFWDVLTAVEPDLLISEIEMPYLSGIEICKIIRTHPRWYQLPIIYLSKSFNINIVEKALSGGVNEIIPKGINPRILAQRIISLIKK